MRDYDELIKDLREYAELVDRDMWDCPYMIADNMKQAADAIENLISLLTASNEVIANRRPKWISVEERLPEEGKNVLVCICADGKYDITRGWYDKKQGFCCWDDAAMESANFITHWMPLPSTEGLNET